VRVAQRSRKKGAKSSFGASRSNEPKKGAKASLARGAQMSRQVSQKIIWRESQKEQNNGREKILLILLMLILLLKKC
jgi:hypothetical protein